MKKIILLLIIISAPFPVFASFHFENEVDIAQSQFIEGEDVIANNGYTFETRFRIKEEESYVYFLIRDNQGQYLPASEFTTHLFTENSKLQFFEADDLIFSIEVNNIDYDNYTIDADIKVVEDYSLGVYGYSIIDKGGGITGRFAHIGFDLNSAVQGQLRYCEGEPDCDNPEQYNIELQASSNLFLGIMLGLDENTNYYFQADFTNNSKTKSISYPSNNSWIEYKTGEYQEDITNVLLEEVTESSARISFDVSDNSLDCSVIYSGTSGFDENDIETNLGILFEPKTAFIKDINGREFLLDNLSQGTGIYYRISCLKESDYTNILATTDENFFLTHSTETIQTKIIAESTPNQALIDRLEGYILLQVEGNGEAWYVDSQSRAKYYMRDGVTAYQAMRSFGLGITNTDLEKIPIGFDVRIEELDSDHDGLSDDLERAIGTDPFKLDSDGDEYTDGQEISNHYDPLGSNKVSIDFSLAERLKGRILLQVEEHGEAWYVNPRDGRRYYMKDGDAAYQIMRFLSLGITNNDLSQIPSGSL